MPRDLMYSIPLIRRGCPQLYSSGLHLVLQTPDHDHAPVVGLWPSSLPTVILPPNELALLLAYGYTPAEGL